MSGGSGFISPDKSAKASVEQVASVDTAFYFGSYTGASASSAGGAGGAKSEILIGAVLGLLAAFLLKKGGK